MLALILELWFHGEEVPTPLPWLIPTEASHCSGRGVEREWPVECAWNQVHTTADAVGSPGDGTQPVLDWNLLEQQILVWPTSRDDPHHLQSVPSASVAAKPCQLSSHK